MNYKNLCIYELRKLAREIGVKSPTSLKRAELIEKINAIETGKELPFIKKTNKGRPVKKLNFEVSKEFFDQDFLNLLLTIKEYNTKQNEIINDFIKKIKK